MHGQKNIKFSRYYCWNFTKLGHPSCIDTLQRLQVQNTTDDTAYTTVMKTGGKVKE